MPGLEYMFVFRFSLEVDKDSLNMHIYLPVSLTGSSTRAGECQGSENLVGLLTRRLSKSLLGCLWYI